MSFSGGSFGCSGGLVVAVRVEDEVAEELSGGGVDDADLEVLDEQDDVGSGVGSAGADVVESAGVAQGEAAGLSTRSCRIRSWVSGPRVGPGRALGRVV